MGFQVVENQIVIGFALTVIFLREGAWCEGREGVSGPEMLVHPKTNLFQLKINPWQIHSVESASIERRHQVLSHMTELPPQTTTLTMTTISTLTAQLTVSLRKPTRGTLALIDRALSYLIPFESPRARTVSASERSDLLKLLDTHRPVLSPYLDTDRVGWNLRHQCS